MLPKRRIGELPSAFEFRRAFSEQFNKFAEETNVLASGNAEFNDTWVDILGKEGLGLSITVIVGVIGILGALSILSAALSAGIAIPVAVVGIAAGVGFYKLREHIKQKRYERASDMLYKEDLPKAIDDIADVLVGLYQVQLNSCTLKDAHVLAEGCMKVIAHNILTNKKFNLGDLFSTSSLQATFMRSLSKVPKSHLDMNIVTKRKFNMRGLMGHSAYYCKETDEFYKNKKSKPAKYGVLLFDKKADIEDYESILETHLVKMPVHEVNTMMRSSMFQAYRSAPEARTDIEEVMPGKMKME